MFAGFCASQLSQSQGHTSWIFLNLPWLRIFFLHTGGGSEVRAINWCIHNVCNECIHEVTVRTSTLRSWNNRRLNVFSVTFECVQMCFCGWPFPSLIPSSCRSACVTASACWFVTPEAVRRCTSPLRTDTPSWSASYCSRVSVLRVACCVSAPRFNLYLRLARISAGCVYSIKREEGGNTCDMFIVVITGKQKAFVAQKGCCLFVQSSEEVVLALKL